MQMPKAPDSIELRHLRSFVAVAEELNFGRAADRLFLSQPALSRQIKMLERIMGCQLLKRSTHLVELTLAGEVFLSRVRPLMADLNHAVSETRSIGDQAADRATRMTMTVLEHTGTLDALSQMRAAFEALNAQLPIPTGIEVRAANAAGTPSLVVGADVEQPPSILMLHGGAYVMGSAFGYRPLAGALSAATGATVLVPDYRLAPEHPYPAALDDAQRAFDWLLEIGVDPQQVTVTGDSSGGGLAMSLLIRLQQRQLPMPGRAALLSPGLDLTGNVTERTNDSVDLHDQWEACVAAYLSDTSPDDRTLNPLTTELDGLPPLLIQVGTGDYVLDEATTLADHAINAGVDARLDLYPVATHVFHLFWSFLPEAAEAIDNVVRFIADTGGASTRQGAAVG